MAQLIVVLVRKKQVDPRLPQRPFNNHRKTFEVTKFLRTDGAVTRLLLTETMT